jgi:hypothetical protein
MCLSIPDALFSCSSRRSQLLHRQEQEGCGKDSIAETLAALWDAWCPGIHMFLGKTFLHLLFGRFFLGDMASAVTALRRCIDCKIQVGWHKLKRNRAACRVHSLFFSTLLMYSTDIRNRKRQCAAGWLCMTFHPSTIVDVDAMRAGSELSGCTAGKER